MVWLHLKCPYGIVDIPIGLLLRTAEQGINIYKAGQMFLKQHLRLTAICSRQVFFHLTRFFSKKILLRYALQALFADVGCKTQSACLKLNQIICCQFSTAAPIMGSHGLVACRFFFTCCAIASLRAAGLHDTGLM